MSTKISELEAARPFLIVHYSAATLFARSPPRLLVVSVGGGPPFTAVIDKGECREDEYASNPEPMKTRAPT